MSRPFADALDLTDVADPMRTRFWSKVDVRGDDECWEWTEWRDRDGYGRFYLRTGVYVSASRASLAMATALAIGDVACHSCDNPPCVNPGHLFKGTQSDNGLDCVAKGRNVALTGEQNPRHKLTEGQVAAIRAEPHRYGIYRELARIYGVSDVMIRNIRLGRNWRAVA